MAVDAIVNSNSFINFLLQVTNSFNEGDLFEIEKGKLSCVFDEIYIEHKGSGYFSYTNDQIVTIIGMLKGITERPINIEFHEKRIKILI
ncbi:MAG: hypothetical protein EOO42_22520 [Flavobacteriales bacterium]|nr:MAG: hypothetical protein EOO42_22520 [Flavobacteriales bacterium]